VRKTSRNVIKLYQTMVFWCDGLQRVTTCWHAREKAGVEFSEEQQKILHEAADHLRKAKALVTGIYSTEIGALVTSEIRSGEWSKRGAK
jgi:hypothetical protein